MHHIKTTLTIALTLLGTSSVWGHDSSAKDQSGAFIGVGVGTMVGYTSILKETTQGTAISQSTKRKANSNLMYGLQAGYQQYFNAYNGLRAYGTFDYSDFSPPLSTQTLHLLKYSLNLDYLLNFSDSPSPWGFFVGMGYQWIQSKELTQAKEIAKTTSDMYIQNKGFLLNLGFSKLIDNHNRLELGIKAPLYNYAEVDHSDADAIYESTMRNIFDIYFSYNYVF
ncbi:hypothetical protein BKH46_01280 [Helicobacter sp. 12S02634-8]|uniref:outer membrane beta-barrel protein n=1 Tax=Helicobacter sp. 12S02634-8 TaxID=1476199 RepID=UPI000BA6A5AD|nr:outer membrane beta-barrel protein [Helicobacter sp. 12S02634-8]PAF48564.1 hypothetical protein BKH46_01280 [Helicobacter sp. 12S02634-8]